MRKRRIVTLILALFMVSIFSNIALATNENASENNGNVKAKTHQTGNEKLYNKQNGDKLNGKELLKQVRKALTINKKTREFTDVKNDWCCEAVTEASVKGFVYGYDDLTFRPNSPVTSLEVIAMLLNAQGLSEEVKNYQLSEEQTAILKKVPDWGKNYVALAIDREILTESSIQTFNPLQGAKRYEVCMYIARLLGEQSASDEVVTTDEDAATQEALLPEQIMEPVRIMQRHQVIHGYPDGSYQPMRVVKRSEIAVMLNQLDQNCLQRFSNQTIKGDISKIENNDTGLALTIIGASGKEIIISTDQDTKIFYLGGSVGTTFEIAVGSQVTVLADENGVAVLVKIVA